MWQPEAWLHFTDVDPIKAAALFNAAGVRWVSQRLTTVYEARDANGAATWSTNSFPTCALPNVGPTGCRRARLSGS
ncbi:hypothetical protein AN933_26630 [Mycobacterium intracellulare subsp. chimaera]|nr:hypothetical protein AN933_26630 [Mycobacterium intracellulare subsp. chimaera]